MVNIAVGQNLKPRLWDSITFPILSYLGPSAEIISDSIFQDMVDAGFTANLSICFTKPDFTTPSRELNLKMLDAAQRVGLKLVICDTRINLPEL